MSNDNKPLTIALPKGRLQKQVQNLFKEKGIDFSFEDRKLVAYDKDRKFKFILVKNSDLPVYVKHGIAGLGVCGSDVIYESGEDFYKLLRFSFGGTTMCLAGMKGEDSSDTDRKLKIATKFTKFTEDYYSKKGIPVEIIKLNGSVELAPVLGLAPYIVDLVETGSTLKANNLEIFKKLHEINVYLLANPAYFKINYNRIQDLVEFLKEE